MKFALSKIIRQNRLFEVLYSQKMQTNLQQFLFTKKIGSFMLFTGGFWASMSHLRKSENEVNRIAAAGAVMVQFVELAFYVGDTANSRSKVHQESLSLMRLLNNVLEAEGANAFAKGISATYYGSVFYGFSYFYSYSWLKVKGNQLFEGHKNQSLIYFTAALISEYAALLLYFPFETVKVRFQSSSHEYTGLCDGLVSVVKNDGLRFLFKGYFWYASHYSLNYSIQMALYESMIDRYKDNHSAKYFQNEHAYIIQTAFLCGAVGSAVSNPLEVISVRKQADPLSRVRDIVKLEGYYHLFSRGLFARVIYHSTQSVAVFLTIHMVGQAFNVDLTEIA